MASSDLIDQARELRNNQTPAEAFLWDYLRHNQLDGFKFRRQHPFHGYILDFYCARARIGIEVDGGVHLDPEQVELDLARTSDLQEKKIEIIRFWNSEIIYDIDSVLEKVKNAIGNRMHLI